MRFETCYHRSELDGRGAAPAEGILRAVRAADGASARNGDAWVRVADVVLVDFPLPRDAAEELFSDPVIQYVAASPVPELPSFAGWDWLVEIAYRPGVTDTLALTAKEALAIVGRAPTGPALVQTARLFVVKAARCSHEIVRKAFSAFWNPLVQSAIFISKTDYERGVRLPDLYPAVSLSDDSEPEQFDVASMDDANLEKLSSSRLLALNLEEMRAVKAYYAAPGTRASRAAAGMPEIATDVEIEMIAQTWSEHCKHKIFNAEIEYSERDAPVRRISSLFKTYIRSTTEDLAPSRPDLLSVFTDNAGVFAFDEASAVCVKAETHNSPSALDPYGGAITGIVGVNRDILGTWNWPCSPFNTDMRSLGRPRSPTRRFPKDSSCRASCSPAFTKASSTAETSRAYPSSRAALSSTKATWASLSCSAAPAASCRRSPGLALLGKIGSAGDARRHGRRKDREGRHTRRDFLEPRVG